MCAFELPCIQTSRGFLRAAECPSPWMETFTSLTFSEKIPGTTTLATLASHTRRPSSRSSPSTSGSSTVSPNECAWKRSRWNVAKKTLSVCVCVCVYSKCVCRWLCRRGTVFPISNPVLREASGCPPTEKTYCGQSRWRPAVSANQALIAVRRTRLRQQRHLVMVLRPRLLPPCFYVVWFDFIFQFLCFIEVNFCQTWLLFYLFFTRVLSVWFLCCVTVDAINDTIPAFYNDTDLFSGEFLPPRSSHSSQCLWRPPCLSELLLLPH